MNILAIETSVPHASLCLALGAEIVFATEWEAERNHDAHLFPALEAALDKLAEQQLDYVLCLFKVILKPEMNLLLNIMEKKLV